MKIFLNLFPELKAFIDDKALLENQIETAIFYFPYVSFGYEKTMLFRDILRYRDEHGHFPQDGMTFFKEELFIYIQKNCIVFEHVRKEEKI